MDSHVMHMPDGYIEDKDLELIGGPFKAIGVLLFQRLYLIRQTLQLFFSVFNIYE